MARDHRGVLFLAAEAAAGLGLHDAQMAVGTQQTAHRLDDVEGTLDRAVDRDAVLLGYGDDAIGLDVDVLLVAGAVGAFDDPVRPG